MEFIKYLSTLHSRHTHPRRPSSRLQQLDSAPSVPITAPPAPLQGILSTATSGSTVVAAAATSVSGASGVEIGSKKRAKLEETNGNGNGKPQLRLDLALPPPEEFGQQASDMSAVVISPIHTCGRTSADHFLRPQSALSPTKQQDQLQRKRLELLGKKTLLFFESFWLNY